MTLREYLRTGPTDLAAVVETLCVAFAQDPVLMWNFPADRVNRSALVEGFFRVTVRMILDHGGTVAATRGHEALGVWSPPGEPALTEAAGAAYAQELLAACGEGGERALTLMAALDEAHPVDLPVHFHVMFAAVLPGHRARGHAAAISHELALIANKAGAGVYAEASNLGSLTVWERLGLRRIGPEIVLPDDGPSLYPIWGDPGTWSVRGTRPSDTPS